MTRIPGPTRPLSTLTTGEAVRIEAILSPAVRSLCADIGLHEGDLVHCRSATGALLLLEPPAGHIIALPRDRARAIRVTGGNLAREAV